MPSIWTPDPQRQRDSRLTDFARRAGVDQAIIAAFDYRALHRWSVDHRAAFWSQLWDFCEVRGFKGEQVLEHGDRLPGAVWFRDARLNFAENLLRPRESAREAIVFWDETGERVALSFAHLLTQVGALRAYLLASGVKAGDRVAAYTHNGPEAVIGMLAAASLGAVWSSASSDFGARGVLDRFGQIDPKVLIASNGYLYKGQKIDRRATLREIIDALPSLERSVVIDVIGGPRVDGADDWSEVLKRHEGEPPAFAPLPFDHPLYIMFSSGTTGAPKCIVHGAGATLLQHLKEHQLQCDVRAGDRVFYATTTGWMMWNWLVSALASEATLLLYDGFPMARDSAILFDLAQAEKASLFGVSAGYLKAAEKSGLKPRETHDLSALRLITSTGSPLAPESYDYVWRDVKPTAQLASISGGTDIVSCFVIANPWGAVRRGEIQGAGLGMAVEVFDAEGRPIVEREGELVCTKPFPSTPLCFWRDADGRKFHEAYFSRYPNIWRHGDFATQTASGGFIIHGRSDATLNPQGVRIGTADIYNIVDAMSEIEESLAIDYEIDGVSQIVLFVKLRSGAALDDALITRIKRKLRDEASPRHAPALVIAAPELPRTRSGKLVELAVREVLSGRSITNSEALANPAALEFFKDLPQLKPRQATTAS